MTLIVSLRTPDGIVIAGDSLATMNASLEMEADINVTCPACSHKHDIKARMGGLPMPTTTFSYAQKVFPFLNEFGVGTFGLGQLTGKTIYFAVRELEKSLKNNKSARPKTVTQAAKALGNHAHGLLKKQIQLEGVDMDKQPDDWKPLGFQVVGYEGEKPLTVEANIGKVVTVTEHAGLGATVSGQGNVAKAIFDLYKVNPLENPLFEVFSLEDAIAYAEFMINTTASHQKFSRTIPGVGGEIDIALVTPFDQFKWIKEKPLHAKIVGEGKPK